MPRMNRLLLLAALRHMRRQPWQTWLTVIGITLGVAVILAVDLANQSARQAFLLSAESLTGRATHQITGGPAGIDESFYRRLRVASGLRRAAPVVEGVVTHGAERLRLVGIDPLASFSFQRLGSGLDRRIFRRLLSEPGTALLSGITAARLAVGRGGSLEIRAAGQPVRLQILDLLEGDNPAALEGLLLADISTAQELLERSGRLDRIDLILDPEQAAALETELPPGLRLEVPASRTRVMAEMIEAFQTNLTAMSLLAMLVGAFLIYNTMTFSVLRRRRQLGTLRLLGVTRGQLFRLLLLEALLLGVAGTVLGTGLGIFIAHYLVALVTRTINDLYFVLTVTRLMVEPLLLVKGGMIGLGVTLLAALVPAIEAAHTLPADALRRSRLESRLRHGLPWLALVGILGLVTGWWLVSRQDGSLLQGFAGLFSLIIGYGGLVPVAVTGLGRIGAPLAARTGVLTRLALRGIDANLSRTGLSIAALSVAVAATLGVGIMIESFRSTVADWLDYTLRSDLYISQADGAGRDLPPAIRPLLESLPLVAETSAGRRTRVDSAYGPVELLALEPASGSYKGFRFTEPPLPQLWQRYRQGGLVLISEPFAYRHRLKTGDRLQLETPGGRISLPVGGIFYDYGSDRGLISLARAAYARLWHDPEISTIGVYLRPGVETAAAIGAIGRRLGERRQALQIRSNREIRERSMAVFDRTFTITRVLRLLAIGVAFAGVLSALMALQLERTRELALLRATGLTRGQLFQLTLMQTGFMGLYAGLLALPLGWLMSEVLIEVINRRAFGWSIMTRLSPGAFPETLLLAVGAALLAGLYPAWRMGRVPPAPALREE